MIPTTIPDYRPRCGGCDHKRESELICDRKARIVFSNDRGDLIVFVRRQRDHRVSDIRSNGRKKKRRGSCLIDLAVLP